MITIAWTPNTHELAWAAGFFDGEGSVWIDHTNDYKGRSYLYLKCGISQIDLRPLHRFYYAVNNLGKVTESKKIYGKSTMPLHYWKNNKWREVQAVMSMLWKYLSEPKRKQYKEKLLEYLSIMDNNTYIGSKPRHIRKCGTYHKYSTDYCRDCHRVYELEYRKRQSKIKKEGVNNLVDYTQNLGL